MGIGTIVGIPIPAGGGIGRYLESFHGASSEIPSPKVGIVVSRINETSVLKRGMNLEIRLTAFFFGAHIDVYIVCGSPCCVGHT